MVIYRAGDVLLCRLVGTGVPRTKDRGVDDMKKYSVEPNKDVTGWFVKIEDTAPTDLYDEKSVAIEKAEELAKENKPSKVSIQDENKEVIEERTF